MMMRTPTIDGVSVADLDRDPYPLYASMRATRPVASVPAVNLWMVTRWDDVHRVTTDEVPAVSDRASVASTIRSPVHPIDNGTMCATPSGEAVATHASASLAANCASVSALRCSKARGAAICPR